MKPENMKLADTIENMTSPEHDDRFKAEYNQLNIRAAKLKYIIDEYHAGHLAFIPKTPILLLEEQYYIMMAYKCILIKRSFIERIDISGMD